MFLAIHYKNSTATNFLPSFFIMFMAFLGDKTILYEFYVWIKTLEKFEL